MGDYAAGQPIGVAYHPTQDLLYAAWVGTPEIRVFETVNFQQVDSFNVGYTFQNNGNWAFVNGRLKTTRDGALLLATVDGGVRVLRTDAAHTRTDLEVSSNPIVAGNPVTLTATVQRVAPAGGTPSGTVTFYTCDPYGPLTQVGSSALDDTGKAAITITPTVGTHEVTATFGGSFEDRSSTAGPISLQVERATTVTQMEVTPAQPVYGQTLVITATVSQVTPGALGSATGSIEILDGTDDVGYGYLDSSGRAQIYVSGLEVGPHCLTATYLGDQNNLNSISSSLCLVVGRADTVVQAEGSVRGTDVGMMAVITVTVRGRLLVAVHPAVK